MAVLPQEPQLEEADSSLISLFVSANLALQAGIANIGLGW